jgi:Uma2 family endonuclease
VLEIMTPSRAHETTHAWMSWLLSVYAEHAGIELSPFGAWLLEDRKRRAGKEPDACYIVGTNWEPRERPDFAVEVEWSRRNLDKLEVYRRLGVREVWIWDGPRVSTITIYVFFRGAWRQRARSKALPALNVDQMCSFLTRSTATSAMAAYREALKRRARRRGR